MAKKHDKLIVNIAVNGIPLASRDDTGDWQLFKTADDHFNPDPNDVLGIKNDEDHQKFTEYALKGNLKAAELLTDPDAAIALAKEMDHRLSE